MNTSLDRINEQSFDTDYVQRLEAMEKANQNVQEELQSQIDKHAAHSSAVNVLHVSLKHVIEKEKPNMAVNVDDFCIIKTNLCEEPLALTKDNSAEEGAADQAEARLLLAAPVMIPSLDWLSSQTLGDLMRQRLNRVDYIATDDICSLTFVLGDRTGDGKQDQRSPPANSYRWGHKDHSAAICQAALSQAEPMQKYNIDPKVELASISFGLNTYGNLNCIKFEDRSGQQELLPDIRVPNSISEKRQEVRLADGEHIVGAAV